MGQILHGSATTTEVVRRAIQNSQASLRELAGRYGINQKTVAKWRRRRDLFCRRTHTLAPSLQSPPAGRTALARYQPHRR
jgi:transposase-like protein